MADWFHDMYITYTDSQKMFGLGFHNIIIVLKYLQMQVVNHNENYTLLHLLMFYIVNLLTNW